MFAPVGGQVAITAGCQILIPKEDRASRCAIETAHDVEQGRLATSGGAEQHNEFALGQYEINTAQCMDGPMAFSVDLRQPGHAKGGGRSGFGGGHGHASNSQGLRCHRFEAKQS
jgi:hypothetical protein